MHTDRLHAIRCPSSRVTCACVRVCREVCEIPSERYLHSAALFDDRTMLVYGYVTRYSIMKCLNAESLELSVLADQLKLGLVHRWLYLLITPSTGLVR